MVLNVLEHIPDVLTYLSSLKNQSVFNFCAIPQVMAIATLALVFNNKDVYQRNVKIRKGEAVKLILASTNINNVVAIFREYIHVLSKKNDASDPNFLNISIAVGKVCTIIIVLRIAYLELTSYRMLQSEQWITNNIPDAPNALVKSSSFPSTLILLAVLAGIASFLYNAYT